MVRSFGCANFVALVACCWSVDIWFEPKNTFLQKNYAILRCHAKVKSYPFNHDFVFYKDDEKLTGAGGVPDFVGTEDHVVYRELTVDSPGTYVCQVDGKNTTAEVFKEPDKPTPVVVELHEDADIVCPKGPPGAEGILDIKNIDRTRIEIKSRRHSVIRNVGYGDVYANGFCHYTFPSDKIIITTKVYLIVVRKEITIPHSDSKTSRTVSCSAFSNRTDINVTLTPNAKDSLNRIYNATTVSEEIHGNATHINCTVWYKGRAIWTSDIFKEEKSLASGGISGLPRFVWIIIGVLGLGIIFVIVISCCRRHQSNHVVLEQRKEHSSGKEKEKGESNNLIETNDDAAGNIDGSQNSDHIDLGKDKKTKQSDNDVKRDVGVKYKKHPNH